MSRQLSCATLRRSLASEDSASEDRRQRCGQAHSSSNVSQYCQDWVRELFYSLHASFLPTVAYTYTVVFLLELVCRMCPTGVKASSYVEH